MITLTKENQCNVCFIGECDKCPEDPKCVCFKQDHGIDNSDVCCYGDENCEPDGGDYELLCDEHRGDFSANIADMRNDID